MCEELCEGLCSFCSPHRICDGCIKKGQELLQMNIGFDHVFPSAEFPFNVTSDFATIPTPQASGYTSFVPTLYTSFVPTLPTNYLAGSLNTVESLEIPKFQQYAYQGVQLPSWYASPLAPASRYANLATQSYIQPDFHNQANSLGLTFNAIENINLVHHTTFASQSPYFLPIAEASVPMATLNPALLHSSPIAQAEDISRYSAPSSTIPALSQRIDSSGESSSSPSEIRQSLPISTAAAGPSNSGTESTKSKVTKVKTYRNSPQRKHKLKNVGKQKPMDGRKRATFRRCPVHTGVNFDNKPDIVKACERCRLARTVTSLLKNIDGRKLIDTKRDLKDSTWDWKREAEQTFRDLFTPPNSLTFAMVYLRIRLVPGQFEQLQDYFDTNGYDLLFQWIR